jgi:hypothetical protein
MASIRLKFFVTLDVLTAIYIIALYFAGSADLIPPFEVIFLMIVGGVVVLSVGITIRNYFDRKGIPKSIMG